MGYYSTMRYQLVITPRARKDLRVLPSSVQKRIRAALEKLAENPFAAGLDVKKLKGQSYYRIRVGDYRVIYDLQTRTLVILVLEAGHRKEIYQ